MTKKHPSAPTDPIDLDGLQRDLASPDEETRLRAVRQVCPCRMGWDGFQQCMDTVKQLQKDPSPKVRGAALHAFVDAFEMDSSGLPTSPRAITNEMVARKLGARWKPLEDPEEQRPGVGKEWKKARRQVRRG